MVVICAYLFRSQIWVAATCSGGTPQAELEGPVTQAWVATFDDPAGDRKDDNEWATAIRTDSMGNVYVTGGGGTVKYDNAGNLLWIYDTIGSDLAVDAVGSVYVTGYYGTKKYDNAGNLLWENAIRGSALALDTFGDVYVTGYYGTAKYAGTFLGTNLLWENDNMGSAIAVDTSGFGRVYVTGFSGTFKYGIAGNLLWKDPTLGTALALDASGNLYITVEDQGGSSRYTTVKFSKDGERLWTAILNGPAYPGMGWATALAVDPYGNIYVTGAIQAWGCMSFPPLFWDVGGTYRDYATVKYTNQVE